jgi:hypothetical protein
MSEYDWTPFATGGAASRADSFTGLDPAFAPNVYELTRAAHAAGFPLQITSAYRSPELQAQLYASALERYGSEAEARRWVAPPGHSQHNFGRAVDYAIDGALLRDADHPAAVWLRENAPNYGVHIPMSWEPWQVEMLGSREMPHDRVPAPAGGTSAGLGDRPLPQGAGLSPGGARRPPPDFVRRGNERLERIGLDTSRQGKNNGAGLIELGMYLMNEGF